MLHGDISIPKLSLCWFLCCSVDACNASHINERVPRRQPPLPFRPGNPALCGSCSLVTPYYCRLGDLLCLFVYAVFVYYFVCVCICVIFVFFSFLCCFPLQLSRSVLWYCWLGLLTCKNRLPYNLHCVVGDIKHCTIQSNTHINEQAHWVVSRPQ